jgi:hypothetical protein
MKLPVDEYVFDPLMRDLIGHDARPSAYLVYLYLWFVTRGSSRRRATMSHQMLAEETGLSKTAVQSAIRLLVKRRLVTVHKRHVTAIPEYTVLRPWRRR